MVLTARNLFYYLQDRGLASEDAVVRGDFRVVNLSRRNLAFHASCGTRGGFVVKQVQQWRPTNIALFEAEAHWYWLARKSPVFAPLTSFFPRCLGYDSANQILLLDFPPGCEDLDGYFRRTDRFPIETSKLLGETLAAFHYGLSPSQTDQVKPEFRRQTPSVLSWHERVDADFNASKGPLEVTRIVRENASFREAFTRLRAGWRPETLINGDMKFAHCILNGPGIYFVDWECGDFGDPSWDTGAIFQEFLWAWLRSIPPGPSDTLEQRAAKATLPIAEIQPAIRAFWGSYVKRAGFDDAEAGEKLRRSVDYTAAWLVQTAYQNLQDALQITGWAVSMVQLSLNILQAPERAAHEMLAL
jgi:hypothetical protein